MKKLTIVSILLGIFTNLTIAEECIKVIQLKYISPDELIKSLDLETRSSMGYHLNLNGKDAFLRFNSANNQLLISCDSLGVKKAIDIINFMDVPPRQIIIETKIIRIDNQKIRETGFDWQNLLDASNVSFNYQSTRAIRNDEIKREGHDPNNQETKQEMTDRRISANLPNLNIGNLLKIIEAKNVGTITNIPKIVTTNNKMGKIMDGDRITYVTRYSSYSNLYETEVLTTGLSLEVTPSIGQSGYLKLDVQAKLTTLGNIISGSPSESGQILESTVIVKNEEPFLLGAFQQTENRKIKRKVPFLGTILPFLFSHDVNVKIINDILIILKPVIIDINPVNIPDLKTIED